MKDNEYYDAGRLAGEQIAAALRASPPAFEKATSYVLGIMAVLKPLGQRVTIPLLLSFEVIQNFMERENLDEKKLRAAATAAHKRWEATATEAAEVKVPRRRGGAARKSGQKTSESVDKLAGPHLKHNAVRSDPALDAPDETVENFVLDVPRELL